MPLTGELAQIIWTALDVETTGLTPLVDDLIEVAAVRFQADRTLDEYSALVNPGRAIPQEAIAVHGITDAVIRKEGRPAREVLPEFRKILGPPTMALVAHNAAFDLGFLATEFARLGIDFPQQPVYDTLELAHKILPGLAHYDLGTVASALGVTADEAHRGLADAHTVMGILAGLAERGSTGSPPRTESRGGGPLTKLAELSRRARPLTFASCAVKTIKAPPGLELLEQAARVGWEVEIVYEGGTQGGGWRRVTPLALLERRGAGYLAAFCHRDQREKFYRLDRIRQVREAD